MNFGYSEVFQGTEEEIGQKLVEVVDDLKNGNILNTLSIHNNIQLIKTLNSFSHFIGKTWYVIKPPNSPFVMINLWAVLKNEDDALIYKLTKE